MKTQFYSGLKINLDLGHNKKSWSIHPQDMPKKHAKFLQNPSKTFWVMLITSSDFVGRHWNPVRNLQNPDRTWQQSSVGFNIYAASPWKLAELIVFGRSLTAVHLAWPALVKAGRGPISSSDRRIVPWPVEPSETGETLVCCFVSERHHTERTWFTAGWMFYCWSLAVVKYEIIVFDYKKLLVFLVAAPVTVTMTSYRAVWKQPLHFR